MPYRTMILCVGDVIRGESTNVAVAIFDDAGKRVASRYGGFERALSRGDWNPSFFDLATEVQDHIDAATTIALTQSRYPSVMWWRQGGSTIQTDAVVVVDDAYCRFVSTEERT